MYEIVVRDKFVASHSVFSSNGKKERPHAHTWQVEIAVRSKSLDKSGMVMNFIELKEILRRELGLLNKTSLDIHPYFMEHMPTTENIARMIFDRMDPKVSSKRLTLHRVTVWETPDAAASYFHE